MQYRLLLITLLLCFSSMQAAYANQLASKSNNQAWLIEDDLPIDPNNISGIALHGEWMALVSDESSEIVLLKKDAQQKWQFEHSIVVDGGKDEIDLEGLTWRQPYLYALGSHSAKRKKLKADSSQKQNLKRLKQTRSEPARQQLFRIKLDNAFKPIKVERLSLVPLLQKHEILNRFIDIPSKENGIDMEGLGIDPKGRLLIGFRGPVLRGNIAAVLRIELKAQRFEIKKTKTLYLQTDGGGIRGISEMGKKLLVLTGAVGDQNLPYQLLIWNGKNALPGKDRVPDSFKRLCQLPITKGKPEGIQFLRQNNRAIEFIVVQDGLKNGQPTQFSCRHR